MSPETETEAELARLSGEEMVAAVGLARAPEWARAVARAAFALPSRPLARALARFDRRIAEAGLPEAASEALRALGARFTVDRRAPAEGPLLVVANHPGAYDALALMAALGRRDLAIIAADRRFLRALSGMRRHFVFVPVDADRRGALARVAALRSASRHLQEGGALLHFPAGSIEPDPAFSEPGEELLAPWQPGTGALVRAVARARGQVAVAVVEGVHAARAKRLFVTRLAERRGITTLAPLIQAAVPGFGDVRVRVRVGAPIEAASLAQEGEGEAVITARVRDVARALLADGARR